VPFFIVRHTRQSHPSPSGSPVVTDQAVADNKPFATPDDALATAAARYPAEQCLIIEAESPMEALFQVTGAPRPPRR
jgi:hypothetical protein